MSRWAWLIPLALSAAIYIPICGGKFVWDDGIVVTQQIIAFKDPGQVFFPPAHIPQWGQNYYRPVIVLTYLLDNWLFGRSPVGGHISNIVFHAAVTFFVWLFAYQCLQRFAFRLWGSIVAACVFAVHPIHTESVSWITGRSDTVAALFIVPSLAAAYHYWNHNKTWALVLSPVLYLLALLSKEVALCTLLVLPFVLVLTPLTKSQPQEQTRDDVSPAFRPKRLKPMKSKPASAHDSQKTPGSASRILALLVPFLAATVLYFLLRHHAVVGHGSSLGLSPGDLMARLWRAVGYYTMKIVVPPPQLHFVTWATVPSLLTASMVLALAASLLWGMARHWKDTGLLVAFTSIWFVCTLAPSLPVAMAKISEAPVAERYLFVPSVGFAILLGGLFCLGAEKISLKKFFIAGAVLIVGLYGAGTLHRNRVWKDNVRLWSDAVDKAPDQGLPWTELGMAYTDQNDLDNARLSFERAVEADYDSEGRSIAYNNLGMIYLRRHDLDKAQEHFEKSIQQRQTYPTPYYGLGLVGLERVQKELPLEQAKEESRNAAFAFNRAVELNPNYTKALWGLVRSYAVLGDIAGTEGNRSEADRSFRLAVQTFDDLVRIDRQFVSQHPEKAAFINQIKNKYQASRPAGP